MFKRITLCFSVFVLFQEKHQLWKQGLRLFHFFTVILKIWNVLKGTIQNRTSWPFICPYPQVSRSTTSRAISSRTVSFEKKQPVRYENWIILILPVKVTSLRLRCFVSWSAIHVYNINYGWLFFNRTVGQFVITFLYI